ncbi:MAG: hypothetical protein IT307_16225 [Chloroflexi bacterium]|nr:hypothetical protein [Chloroflexota bacterium]
MNLLLLHGSGWDELALAGGAVLLAVVLVYVTSRKKHDEDDEADSEEEPVAGESHSEPVKSDPTA